jgi:signal transduction histidine kinase
LYINGKKLAKNGQVSDNIKNFIPYWQYQTVDLNQNTDTLEMILHVANYSHIKGGVSKSIELGTKSQMETHWIHGIAIDLLLTGCLFMGGLFFLGLYLLGSRDKAILLFSLYSIVYSYRIIGSSNYVIHSIFPGFDWFIAIRMEYISLFLSIGLFTLYTNYLHPKDVNKLMVRIISILCFTFALISLIFPPIIFTQLINPFIVVMLSCIFYVVYVYFMAYKQRRPGSLYALISSMMLMIVFLILILNYWHLSSSLQITSFICSIMFFFFQSLILSNRDSFTLKKAKKEAELGLIAKSEFLSTMSHEIRTPIHGIISLTQFILNTSTSPEQREYLDLIRKSADTLLVIVNDILDLSKIDSGKMAFESVPFHLRDTIQTTLSAFIPKTIEKNIQLNTSFPENLPEQLTGDPVKLIQILNNLLGN